MKNDIRRWSEIRRAFKTFHSFWKKAQKLVALEQSDHDMISYVSKAQSVVEEMKIYLEADTSKEMKKLDNVYVMLVLQGMHPDYKHVHDQILTSQELPFNGKIVADEVPENAYRD
ncbi:hypothetical protein HKD37_02G005794 [Glycine soja]